MSLITKDYLSKLKSDGHLGNYSLKYRPTVIEKNYHQSLVDCDQVVIKLIL